MVDKVDLQIARIASRQHGLVTTAQLVGCGLSRTAISKRARGGRLHRRYRGVYAVGYPASGPEERWMAAVLACGDGALLSHGSAAALWGLIRPLEGPVDVSVPSQSGRLRRDGMRIHRSPTVVGTVRRSIPVTTVERTIEDLRGAVPDRLHRRAVRDAELRGYALAPRDRGDRTRSDLERDFLAFCARHRIPRPAVNVRVGRLEVDFLWRAERLVVETDGFRYHRGSIAFEDDRARELELRRQGFAVRRFTGRQLEEEPGAVAADIRAGLQISLQRTGSPNRGSSNFK